MQTQEYIELSGPLVQTNKWYSPVAKYEAICKATRGLRTKYREHKDLIRVSHASRAESDKRNGVRIPEKPDHLDRLVNADYAVVKGVKRIMYEQKRDSNPLIRWHLDTCDKISDTIEERILDMQAGKTQEFHSRGVRMVFDVGVMAVSYLFASAGNDLAPAYQIAGAVAVGDIVRNAYILARVSQIDRQVNKLSLIRQNRFLS